MFRIVAELLLYWYRGGCRELDAVLSAKWLPHISLVQSSSSGWVRSGCPLIHLRCCFLYRRWCSAVVSNVESAVEALNAVVDFCNLESLLMTDCQSEKIVAVLSVTVRR